MDISTILYLILIFIILSPFLLEIYWRTTQGYKSAKMFPGAKMYPFIGNLLDLINLDTEQVFEKGRKNSQKYGKCHTYYGLGQLYLILVKADEAEIILSVAKHLEKAYFYQIVHSFLETGLLTSSGEKWFHRRRILTPTFHFHILEQFLNIFKEQSEKFIDFIEHSTNVSDREGIDVVPICDKIMLETICETAMGLKIEDTEESEVYKKNICEIGKLWIYRFARPIFHYKLIWKIFGYQRIEKQLLTPIKNFTRSIIRKRRKDFFSKKIVDPVYENIYMTKRKRHATLDTLLTAESEGLIDSEGIREEVDTFTFGGHDTTAASLTFVLLLLAHHPEAQEGILKEIKASKNFSDRSYSIHDIKSMNYFDRVFRECLRLYPPAFFIARTLSEDVFIDEVLVPSKTVVLIHIFEIHRDPKYFPDPEKFDPDRFLPENVAKRHPFAYIPFSAGIRNCIGQKFAMAELKTMVIEILKKFSLSPVTRREDVVLCGDMILRSKYPIIIKFTKRV